MFTHLINVTSVFLCACRDTSLSIESDVQTTNTTSTPKAHIVEMSHDLPWNPPRVSHDCQEECWVYGREYPGWRLCSPLDLPLKLGWRRYMYTAVHAHCTIYRIFGLVITDRCTYTGSSRVCYPLRSTILHPVAKKWSAKVSIQLTKPKMPLFLLENNGGDLHLL